MNAEGIKVLARPILVLTCLFVFCFKFKSQIFKKPLCIGLDAQYQEPYISSSCAIVISIDGSTDIVQCLGVSHWSNASRNLWCKFKIYRRCKRIDLINTIYHLIRGLLDKFLAWHISGVTSWNLTLKLESLSFFRPWQNVTFSLEFSTWTVTTRVHWWT